MNETDTSKIDQIIVVGTQGIGGRLSKQAMENAKDCVCRDCGSNCRRLCNVVRHDYSMILNRLWANYAKGN